jgi:hypothetical protein
MLFKQRFLTGLRSGEITLAFRKWTKPSVRPGGTLKTPIGVLAIESLKPVRESAITPTDARRAGYASRGDLVAELRQRAKGSLYRVQLRYIGADPRIALREQSKLSVGELEELRRRLKRLDLASRFGPWTAPVLRLLAQNPAVRAGDLAPLVGQETAAFKLNVRKLKNLGLTESLGTGYRLSPRGRIALASLQKSRGS